MNKLFFFIAVIALSSCTASHTTVSTTPASPSVSATPTPPSISTTSLTNSPKQENVMIIDANAVEDTISEAKSE